MKIAAYIKVIDASKVEMFWVSKSGFPAFDAKTTTFFSKACTCVTYRVAKKCPHGDALLRHVNAGGWKSLFVSGTTGGETIPLIPGQLGIIGNSADGSEVGGLLPPYDCPKIETLHGILEEEKPVEFSLASDVPWQVLVRSLERTFAGVPMPVEPIKTEPGPGPFYEAPLSSSAVAPPSRSLTHPIPEDFVVGEDVWETLIACVKGGDNAILFGPTGSGKSSLVYKIGAATGVPVSAFNFGAMTEPRISLIGATHFNKESGTLFKESRFVRAIRSETPHIVLLDEITRAGRDAFNIILPLSDDQRYVALDESEEASIVSRNKGVSFIATANVGFEYTGTEAMDIALKNRFHYKVHLDYPSDTQEFALIMQRFSGADKKFVKKIVNIASEQRSLTKQGMFSEAISTRMLLDAAKAALCGLDFKWAMKFVILGNFSSDGGGDSEQAKLVALIQKKAPELV
jgi:nitric oxide reductase NorQ protein